MRIYKVTAKFGDDTIKFVLPYGVPQDTLNEALTSARIASAKAFGYEYNDITWAYQVLSPVRVTVEEAYED